ncbi:MAG: hypothetical protein A2018_00500 [Alphaproteobacteria bacterium GWF2_58_20]|nr:MAG: hypothetical protein A2018_00500 [Alphaproteobacteria bacterium GWF2_58_20]
MDIVWWPLTFWHWLVLAVLLLGGEILTPSTYLVWPSSAAGFVGVLLFFAPGLPWQVQVTIFALASIASNFLWFRWQKDHPGGEGNPNLNQRTRTFIGQKACVEQSFANGQGSVKVGDTVWQARMEDGSNPSQGTSVEIISSQGTILTVK